MPKYQCVLQYDKVIEAKNVWQALDVALAEIENHYIPNMECEEIEDEED